MKVSTILLTVLTLASVLAVLPAAHADNPIIQTRYTADPAPVVIHGKVYLYTDHDENHATWFVMKDWRLYTSSDMVNWTDEGSPLSLKTFSWAEKDAWAPQVIERNGLYYCYAPMTQKGVGMSIGVAVASRPQGPFHDALGHPLVHISPLDIDPTVFIDRDGQAYLYWGNSQLYYVKLNRDMISYDQKVGIVKVPLTVAGFGKGPRMMPGRTTYVEGPWFYRRGDLYYMVYAAGGIPEFIAYSTSPGPTGPWTYRGIIMPNHLPHLAFTNHPGVIDYKGHSYFFYHNQALPGGGGFDRSVCVEEFKYNPDGSFPTILPTSKGAPPIGHLNPFRRTRAATIAWESGIQTEELPAAGVCVTNPQNGAYIKVEAVDFGGKGAHTLSVDVASDQAASSLEVHIDSVDGPTVGMVKIPNTGGLDKWKVLTSAIHGAKGVHDLFFVFRGAPGSELFNFAWWKFGN